MFDTHVNLHGDAFQDDRDDVISRARQAGITRMITICDRFDNFPKVLEIARSNPGIWCSVGTHPHHAKDFPDLSADTLLAETVHPEVVAIGEAGLDFHYGYSPQEDQVRCFRAQIDAARAASLPLIIHTREADDLTGDILEDAYRDGPFTPLLHCYTGGPRLAQRALDLGAYFSVSGILSFRSARDVRAVISQIPIERIILETDCPYLAPVPMRGRRNEPAFLVHVAEALASVKEMSPEDVCRMTESNALRLFSKAAGTP